MRSRASFLGSVSVRQIVSSNCSSSRLDTKRPDGSIWLKRSNFQLGSTGIHHGLCLEQSLTSRPGLAQQLGVPLLSPHLLLNVRRSSSDAEQISLQKEGPNADGNVKQISLGSRIDSANNFVELLELCKIADNASHASRGYFRAKRLWKQNAERIKDAAQVMQVLNEISIKTMPHFVPREISWLFSSHATLGIRLDSKFQEIVEARMLEKVTDFPLDCLLHTMWSYGKLAMAPGNGVFEALIAQMRRYVSTLTADELNTWTWAFVDASNVLPSDLMLAVNARTLQIVDSLSAKNMVNMVLYLSKTSSRHLDSRHLVVELSMRMPSMIPDLNEREAAAMLFSLGKLNLNPKTECLQMIEAAIRPKVQDLSAINVGRVTWAYARLGVRPTGDLLQMLMLRMLFVVHDMKDSGLVSMLWALAKLGAAPGKDAIRILSARVEDCMSSLNAHKLVSVLSSFASMGARPADNVIAASQPQLVHLSADLSADDIARAMSAFAKFGLPMQSDLVSALEERCMHCMDDFQPHHMSMMLRAYVQIGMSPAKGLVDVLTKHISDIFEASTPSEKVDVMQSCTSLGLKDIVALFEAGSKQDPAGNSAADKQHGTGTPRGGTYNFVTTELRQHRQAMYNKIVNAESFDQLLQMCDDVHDAGGIAAVYNRARQLSTSANTKQLGMVMYMLRDKVIRCMHEFSPRHVNMSLGLWEIRQVRLSHDVQRALEARVASDIDRYEHGLLTRILRLYAKLKMKSIDEAFVSAVQARLLKCEAAFTEAHVVDILRALASFGVHPSGPLLDVLNNKVVQFCPNDFMFWHVHMSLCAYAKLQIDIKDEILPMLTGRAKLTISHANPSGLASLVYGYAEIGVKPDQELRDQIVQRAHACMNEFVPGHLAKLMRSFAALGMHPGEPFLVAVREQVLATCEAYTPSRMISIVWAYAKFKMDPGRNFLDTVGDRMVASANFLRDEHLPDMVWACNELGVFPGQGMLRVLDADGKIIRNTVTLRMDI